MDKKTKSEMGYRDDSPYRNEPFIDINTPNGLIDMSNTGRRLKATDSEGNTKILERYSGMHQFEPGIVREEPVDYEEIELTDEQIEEYRNGGYVVEELPTYQGDINGSEVDNDRPVSIQALPEFQIVGGTEGEDFPYYNNLNAEQKKLLRDPSPIGRGIRSQATHGYGLDGNPSFTESVYDFAAAFPKMMGQTAGDAFAIPQALAVEEIERLRGNPYDYRNAIGNQLKEFGTEGYQQRVPSETLGFEQPEGFWENAANIGMDVGLDPTNLVGAGLAGKALKAEKFLAKGLKGLKGLKGSPNSIKAITKPVVKDAAVLQKEVKPAWILDEPSTNTLQIKSTMKGSPFEKQISKNGQININNIKAHANKQNTGKQDKFIINKVLKEKFTDQSKIDYNEFKKAISDELIPLEKSITDKYSGIGLERLGYNNNKLSVHLDWVADAKKDLAKTEETIDFFKKTIKEADPKAVHPDGTNKLADYKKSLIAYEKDEKIAKHYLALANKGLDESFLKNESLVYGNKNKFGKGDTAHFDDEGTLGHARTLTSQTEPDIMHVLESQSDYYQGRKLVDNDKLLYKTTRRLENNRKKLTDSEEYYNKLKSGKSDGIDIDGYPVQDYQIVNAKMSVDDASRELNSAIAEAKNPFQKQLLGKNHEERLLQENILHAVEEGQSKVRYPTSETAAKIQGYSTSLDKTSNLMVDVNKIPSNELVEYKKLLSERSKYFGSELDSDADLLNKYSKKLNVFEKKYPFYSPEHQTILKKYDKAPKMIKKTIGQDTKIVTDAKGNTWYEFDVPDAAKKGQFEMKAFKDGGEIMDLTDQQIAQYRAGGYVVDELPMAQDGLSTSVNNVPVPDFSNPTFYQAPAPNPSGVPLPTRNTAGTLKKTVKQPLLEKAYDIASNPLTALANSSNGIPDNMGQAIKTGNLDRNALEMGMDVLNPVAYANLAGDTYNDIEAGNYGMAALNAASMIPGIIDTGKYVKGLKGSPNNMTTLYRVQEKNAKTFAKLYEEGKVHKLFRNKEVLARKAKEEKHFGEWFTKDKSDLDWYKGDREFVDPEIIELNVPNSELSKFKNYDKSLSRAPDREFVVPLDLQNQYTKGLKGSPNIVSSLDDAFPITLTTPDSGYKFPKASPDAKSLTIHETNKLHDLNWVARNNIETFFKENNIDIAKLPQSQLVDSKVGYDYVLPEGVTHDMLNEYARLHHSKFPITEEFKRVGEAIKKLNFDANVNPLNSHSIHGVASNIHPDFNGIMGEGLKAPKQLKRSTNTRLNAVPEEILNKDFSIDKYLTKKPDLDAWGKEVAELEELQNVFAKKYSGPDMERRFANIGILPKDMPTKPPKLKFETDELGLGSHYDTSTGTITINLSKIKKLQDQGMAIDVKTIYEHELGHFFQDVATQQQPEFKKLMGNYENSLDEWDAMLEHSGQKVLDDYGLTKPNKPEYGVLPTRPDKYASTIQPSPRALDIEKSLENYNYFTRDAESYAHVREMREAMINKGYLKNIEEKVTDKKLMDFISENPNDRISSFINPTERDLGKLKQVMNAVPAVVPVAVGAGLMQEQDGGQILDLSDEEIAEYRAGGYVVEEVEMQSGGTVSELWKQHTGTPWSEAHAQNLTSGTYDDNMALRRRILNGEFDQASEEIVNTANQDISFSDAFAGARREQGPGGRFVWNGRTYGTNYKTESNVKKQEPETAIEPTPEQIQEPMVRSPYMQPPSPFMLPGEEAPIIKDNIPTSDVAPIRPTTPYATPPGFMQGISGLNEREILIEENKINKKKDFTATPAALPSKTNPFTTEPIDKTEKLFDNALAVERPKRKLDVSVTTTNPPAYDPEEIRRKVSERSNAMISKLRDLELKAKGETTPNISASDYGKDRLKTLEKSKRMISKLKDPVLKTKEESEPGWISNTIDDVKNSAMDFVVNIGSKVSDTIDNVESTVSNSADSVKESSLGKGLSAINNADSVGDIWDLGKMILERKGYIKPETSESNLDINVAKDLTKDLLVPVIDETDAFIKTFRIASIKDKDITPIEGDGSGFLIKFKPDTKVVFTDAPSKLLKEKVGDIPNIKAMFFSNLSSNNTDMPDFSSTDKMPEGYSGLNVIMGYDPKKQRIVLFDKDKKPSNYTALNVPKQSGTTWEEFKKDLYIDKNTGHEMIKTDKYEGYKASTRVGGKLGMFAQGYTKNRKVDGLTKTGNQDGGKVMIVYKKDGKIQDPMALWGGANDLIKLSRSLEKNGAKDITFIVGDAGSFNKALYHPEGVYTTKEQKEVKNLNSAYQGAGSYLAITPEQGHDVKGTYIKDGITRDTTLNNISKKQLADLQMGLKKFTQGKPTSFYDFDELQ